MRVAAVLGVKDEVELVEGAIAHLWMVGVDQILAYDVGSVDGTVEILRQHCSDRFEVISFTNELQNEIVDARILNFVHRLDAEWVIFLDADEKWIPLTGNLKHCAERWANADVIMVDRFNVPMGPLGPWSPPQPLPPRFDELMLITNPDPEAYGINWRTRLRDNPDFAWIMGIPARKMMARPQRIAQLANGWHDVIGTEGPPLRRVTTDDLLIAHYPMTTWSRFARKMANIREVIGIHGGTMHPDDSWHWRRWLDLSERDELQEEFRRSVLSEAQLTELRRQGIVKSAAELFASRSMSP